MIDEDTVKKLRIKTIKDLELMAKKLKKRIVLLEKDTSRETQDMVNIVHAITLLTSEYRLIKREIMETIML